MEGQASVGLGRVDRGPLPRTGDGYAAIETQLDIRNPTEYTASRPPPTLLFLQGPYTTAGPLHRCSISARSHKQKWPAASFERPSTVSVARAARVLTANMSQAMSLGRARKRYRPTAHMAATTAADIPTRSKATTTCASPRTPGTPTSSRSACAPRCRSRARAHAAQANPEYLSVNWEASGGGAFAVIPLNEKGRVPEQIPLFRGHTAAVLDTDWYAPTLPVRGTALIDTQESFQRFFDLVCLGRW